MDKSDNNTCNNKKLFWRYKLLLKIVEIVLIKGETLMFRTTFDLDSEFNANKVIWSCLSKDTTSKLVQGPFTYHLPIFQVIFPIFQDK